MPVAGDGVSDTRYVGFCDILGFSNRILADFDKTLEVYRQFGSALEFARRRSNGHDVFGRSANNGHLPGPGCFCDTKIVVRCPDSRPHDSWRDRKGGIGKSAREIT